ncbi:hypothetical protein [Paenibacillus kobensis]|uniref:hypothetical protein n=1 Tax=Paenibacillus kobensis TaxID=59841 RepID=UPI000FD6D35A|nr:hypothetical protein [Paenibacillus kobensis]
MFRTPLRKTKIGAIIVSLMLAAVLLAGCGGGKDVSMFIFPKDGMPDDVAGKVEEQLQTKMGDKSVEVFGSPLYNEQKMIVEFVAGERSILAIPKDFFLSMVEQGGVEPLDELFKPEDFPDGFMTGTVYNEKTKEETKEKHLYGIPVKQSAMFQGVGYTPDDLYLVVPSTSPNEELSKQAMKGLINP